MFFGREEQLSRLAGLWNKRVSSFVTCRGRRRIGKSSLIEKFAELSNCRFIEITGAAIQPKMNNASQLRHFSEQLCNQSTLPKGVSVDSWMTAFQLLDSVISNEERTVVLLDEVSWMGKFDPDFAGALKTVWDKSLKKHDRLVLVVCGSVSTWIQRNILENTAFAGRLSLNLVVDELPLRLCAGFWGERANRLTPSELIDVLSVTGGVPKYLEEIDPTVSAAENIRRMCFLPDGPLVDEFDQIFSEVFEDSAEFKKKILRSLSAGPLTGKDIAAAMGVDRNGYLTRSLEELETAGFVAREGGLNPATDAPLKCCSYRIRDNYTRFYLHHLEPRRTAIKDGSFAFTSLEQLPGWHAIAGLQFENLVVSHYQELLPRLNPSRALIKSVAPYRKGGKGGLQIDLLLQMERALYVVEVKHQRKISREIEREMSEKIARLAGKTGKSVRVALVYDGELDSAVVESGYFDVLVSSSELLGLEG